jgi:hypothetical protein
MAFLTRKQDDLTFSSIYPSAMPRGSKVVNLRPKWTSYCATLTEIFYLFLEI